MSEWLRRWTRNPLGSARRGSNPLGVDTFLHYVREIVRCRIELPKNSSPRKAAWPSGLRRQLQALVRKGASSNLAAVTFRYNLGSMGDNLGSMGVIVRQMEL